jgi:glucokinase
MAKTSKSRNSAPNYTVGIDLGGTKLAAALVDGAGRVVHEVHRATVPGDFLAEFDPKKHLHEEPPAKQVRRHIRYVVEAMAEAAVEVAAHLPPRGKIVGYGLASAGPMNIIKGTLESPSNFVGWKQVPLVKLLSEQLGKRGLKGQLHFQNDAIAAALGEGWIGRAKGANTYAVVTVGTGIGSGVILNGRPAQSGGMGSEWGHILVHAPGIGRDREGWYERSVEGLASGTGIVRRAKARGSLIESSTLLAKAAHEGDALALELFSESAEALATLFYSLSLGFHPEVFVVSGGMLAIRELFLPQAIELYRDLMSRTNAKFLAPIKIAKLGTLSGVIGAARLPYLG